MVKSLVEMIFFYKIACQTAQNGISDLLDFEIFLVGADPPRGSCLWHSLLPLPTFIFKPSTPKVIKNPVYVYVYIVYIYMYICIIDT